MVCDSDSLAVCVCRVANSKTGRMLSSLMYYTAERKRKSAHGASVPPKATLHLRPVSSAISNVHPTCTIAALVSCALNDLRPCLSLLLRAFL